MHRLLLVVLALAVAACTGDKREIKLAALDGSAIQATAYLEEVTGKSGKTITARMAVEDPAGRTLVGALVEGRCASIGAFVDTIQISTVTGHFRGSSPTTIKSLAGTHAIGLFVDAGFSEDAPGTPVACADL
jgi:hypothetical protein